MSNENKLKAKWAVNDDREIDEAILQLILTREGRRFIWWLLQTGGVGRQPFARNALETSFNCGVLDVGQQILARLTTVSPEGYVLIMKENADEFTQRNAELAGAISADRDAARGYASHPE